MQRLVLAILFVALVVAALAVVLSGLRAAMGGSNQVIQTGHDGMQKIAFALLMALIAYVAFAGGS